MGSQVDFRSSKYLPQVAIDQLKDPLLQRNFKNLQNFFDTEIITMGFRFMEFTLDKETVNAKFAHNLGYIPKDVLVTRLTGEGQITFNYNLFDNRNIDVTVTGPVKVRLFIGTYRKETASGSQLTDADIQTFSAGATTESSSGSATDPGVIAAFGGPPANIPSGWLYCDGAAYTIQKYPDLFAKIGWYWGKPNVSTFRVPDFRGLFLRGLDTSGQARDPDVASRQSFNGSGAGASVGSYQADELASHRHLVLGGAGAPGTRTFDGGNGSPAYPTGFTGGNETRPKNVAVIYMIKT